MPLRDAAAPDCARQREIKTPGLVQQSVPGEEDHQRVLGGYRGVVNGIQQVGGGARVGDLDAMVAGEAPQIRIGQLLGQVSDVRGDRVDLFEHLVRRNADHHRP